MDKSNESLAIGKIGADTVTKAKKKSDNPDKKNLTVSLSIRVLGRLDAWALEKGVSRNAAISFAIGHLLDD